MTHARLDPGQSRSRPVRRHAGLGALVPLALALLLGDTADAAAETVDLELVLAADGSGSIDPEELKLQREGYASALTSPEVMSAIASNLHGAIAVLYLEWGAPSSQDIVVDWMTIRTPADADAFADRLRAAPRRSYGYNSISNAILFADRLMRENAAEGLKRVIDVSGDGPNIGGAPIREARDQVVAGGTVINALSVRRAGSQTAGSMAWTGQPLEDYYRDNVIGGPGAFVEIADETRRFTDAVRSKLVQEIAGIDAARRIFAAATPATPSDEPAVP
ncbi:Protein of unknown function [Pseudoxanthobacter soli DSM 19599]|uniref:VWFA domain-containing protein n=1 Tax=Pseudoxanthobacter soli DSM 19599 TaxID=1123029 RepID=A0A1M7Z5G8_9HYPH|nr:DUF1194 domain-containing protein [Pseudoxanthobacter soli]SHO59886.1 Protein of unknown function [Pseudoxanthobacter soli DSM 19599]